MRIRVQIPRTLLKSQLLWQRTVCESGQLTCHSSVRSSEQETSPLTGWEVKVDTCHCPNLHRQHTEHYVRVCVCCVCMRVYAHTCTAYLMCVPTFKKSGWVPLVSLLVFSCLYFIWTPLMEGRSANRWLQPLYFRSLFCPVLCSTVWEPCWLLVSVRYSCIPPTCSVGSWPPAIYLGNTTGRMFKCGSSFWHVRGRRLGSFVSYDLPFARE